MDLKSCTVLITGGTSGIGLELVNQLVEKGAEIIVIARKEVGLRAVMKKFPNVHSFRCDVSNPEEVRVLYDEVIYRFPSLNMIINCAGEMRLLDFHDSWGNLENLTREIDINLKGTMHMVHQFLPHLLSKGKAAIVNVSSAIAFMSYSTAPIYSSSKAGVHAYTQALRLQLEKSKVMVFEVIPAGVKTSLYKNWLVTPDPGQLMAVEKMVKVVIKGLEKEQLEIRVGFARFLKFASRWVPEFILRYAHRDFEKFHSLNNLNSSI